MNLLCRNNYFKFSYFCQGEKTFFLQPGEKLARGIQDVYVLEEDEGLILRCTESFKEDEVSLWFCSWIIENNDDLYQIESLTKPW